MGITSNLGLSIVKFMWVPTHLGVSANLSMSGTYSRVRKDNKALPGIVII